MSKFSNPSSRAPGESSRYVRDLLELLGDRDPVEVQRALIPELRTLLAGLSDGQLRRPEAPGKWSIVMVLDHLVDQELVTGYRLRAVVAEPEPELRGYDQDSWAQRLRYGQADAEVLLEELDVLRRRNLRLLAALEPGEWARAGRHAERGPESVARLTALMAGHDLVHRAQIARIRDAAGPPAGDLAQSGGPA